MRGRRGITGSYRRIRARPRRRRGPGYPGTKPCGAWFCGRAPSVHGWTQNRARPGRKSEAGYRGLEARFAPALLLLTLLLWPGRALFPQDGKDGGIGAFAGSLVLGGRADSLLRLEIPEEVYRGLERPDMADIRVFDAGGFPVPFMIRPVPGRIVEPPPVELPFFPWTEPGAAFPEGADIVIDARGTVLSIKNQGPGPAEAAAAYLLDLSALPSDPSMLNVSLGAEGDIYNAAARIYASADLSRWEELGRPQTLACFGAGGAGRETLELPPGAGRRYLLLKLDRPGLSPRRIRAVFDKFEIPAPPGEKTIDGTWGEDRRSVRYDTGGFYPLRLIDFPLPRPDSVEVLVKYRFTAEEDWREAQRTILFRVNDGSGGTLSGGALETGVSAPLWELEAAGPFPSIPGCTIRWTPQELVFLGRGPGPWTLAWGNGDYDSPGGFPGSLGPNLEDAGIGEARPLGPPRYEARPPPPARKNWEPFILWGVLVIAVLVLSAMAFYIAASMRKEKL